MKKEFLYYLGVLSSFLIILAAIGCVKKEAVSQSPSTLAQPPAERRSMPPTEREGEAPRAGIEGARPGVRPEGVGRVPLPSTAKPPESPVRRETLGEGQYLPSPGTKGETVARVPEKESAIPREATASPLKDIYFDFDKYDLKEETKRTLAEIADWLLKNPGVKLQIEGHTDEKGTDEYNLALGERRAMATFRYLKSLGVREERLSTVSYGEMRPADPGHNEEAWAKNRRGHFVLLAR